MIKINGKEAGGQVLRTSLALSSLTNKPFKIINIRAKREKSGLKEQHLQSILSLKELTNAEVKGTELNSKELIFIPNKITKNKLNISIRTAGSTALLLQTFLIAGVKNNLEIKINGGGTWNKWASPISFYQNVLSYFLKKINYKIDIKVVREGFYPKGGANLKVKTEKTNLKPLEIIEKGKLKEIKGISVASESLKDKQAAERQANKAKELLKNKFNEKISIDVKHVNSLNPGSGLLLYTINENSIISGDSLGEIKKSSEKVAEEAVKDLLGNYKGAVDKYIGDQILPYLALSKGKIKVPEITNHIKNNIIVIEKFLDVNFKIEDDTIEV